MDILIIGGTRFLGRHIVEAALTRGHKLTLFNRGQSNPELFSNVEHVKGDRLEGFKSLKGLRFDAVIDTCAYHKRAVKIATDWFKNKALSYQFISSISVYREMASGQDESGEVGVIEDENLEEITGDTYGPLKALCERVVMEDFPDSGIVVRPGLIVGPHDPTDRFTYWPVRFSRGGEVVAPDRKEQPVQIIDVRDLALFCLNLIEQKQRGTYNATGPEQLYTLSDFLERIGFAVNPNAATRWIPTQILTEKGVEPWSDLPCVLSYDGLTDGMLRADVSKAVGAGLRFRSLEETAKDTLEWFNSAPHELKAGLSQERETEILNSFARV